MLSFNSNYPIPFAEWLKIVYKASAGSCYNLNKADRAKVN